MSKIAEKIYTSLPEGVRDTALLRLFGFTQVPMIGWIKPKIIEMSDQRCAVEIPLNRRTKNHLKSMYFGVLAAGADIAGGFLAMKLIIESGEPIALAFKDFHAEFHKRAEGNTQFVCDQIEEIREFVKMVVASEERHHMPVKIKAICPSIDNEPVAEFTLTLSLKNKRKKKN